MINGETDPTHSKYGDAFPFAESGQIVFVRAFDFPFLEGVADGIVEGFGAPIEGRCDKETERHGESHGDEPLGPDESLRDPESHDDEAELAIGRERGGRHPRGAGAQAEASQQGEEGDAFQREQEEEEERPAQPLPAQRSLEPDLEKESDEEQIGDVVEGFLQFARARVCSDEDSDEERSEIGLEPDDVEDLRPDDEGKKEAAEGEQFPMARTAHDPAEGRPCEEEYGDREDRPGRGNFSGRDGEENDGKDILHHEDADRDPSVCCPEVAVFIERFHGEDGAGKAEGEGEEKGRLPVEPERWREKNGGSVE